MLVAGRPSLPGGPRCREALMPGGPRCREALVAGRPSLPGGSCVAPLKEQLWGSMWPFSESHILEKGFPEIRQECAPNPLSYDIFFPWQNPASISRTLCGIPCWEAIITKALVAKEALVAGALVARRPSLPGAFVRLSTIVKVPTLDFCGEDPHRGSSLWNPLLGSSRYEGPRCQGGSRLQSRTASLLDL